MRTVKAFAAAALFWTYLYLMPMNWGDAPVWSTMKKVCAGSLDRALRGSFKSFRVLSPVFVTVATTFRLATVLTDFGPIFCMSATSLWTGSSTPRILTGNFQR